MMLKEINQTTNETQLLFKQLIDKTTNQWLRHNVTTNETQITNETKLILLIKQMKHNSS